MESNSKNNIWDIILKVILYIFFASAFITIIVFAAGQGWFDTIIQNFNLPYDTLEFVRQILVTVFTASAITSFASSIIAVAILLIRR